MQGMTLELVGLNLTISRKKNNCSWPSCECVSPDPLLWEEN